MTRVIPMARAAWRWLAVLVPMAVAVGTASAGFLWSLDAVTRLRFSHPWLLWLLPAAGFGVGWVYRKWGLHAERGNALLIEEIRRPGPGPGVPVRMAPLVWAGTLVTHLCGGSAGREGTALQMGGGIAAAFARFRKDDPVAVRLLLMAGVAAGFGAVFGTPLAGTVFALEVLVSGRFRLRALLPCGLAAMVAHGTCLGWGAGHAVYRVAALEFPLDPLLFGKVLMAAAAFGLAGAAFAGSTRLVAEGFRRLIPRTEMRPVAGGLLVIALFLGCGSADYLGLGVLGNRPDAVTLPAMFGAGDIPASAWLWKFVFTVVTVGAGFKGGEVTPLFFIGAALGNTLAPVMGAPVDLFAALGFAAIFAGATKAPLASTVLGMELFGAGHGLHLAAACFAARLVSGNVGIYPSHHSPAAGGRD